LSTLLFVTMEMAHDLCVIFIFNLIPIGLVVPLWLLNNSK